MARQIGIVPLADRVLLKEIKAESNKTKSGIFIPESASPDKETKKGEIVAVGAGKYEDGDLMPLTVKVGDTVIYSWGEKIFYEGTEYVLVREADISAIIR